MIPEKDNLPLELVALPQWLLWREEKKGDKLTKIPVAPWKTGHWGAASATDPENWTTFDNAVEWAKKRPGHGVGFAFNGDGIVGIDLDGCIDGAGQVSEFAAEIIKRAKSYCELSPSGRGVHILVKGKILRAIRAKEAGIEIYDRDRFFTITGRRWKEAPLEIRESQELLNELWSQFGEPEKAPLAGTAKREIEIVEVARVYGFLDKLERRGKQLQGPNPVFGSSTGMNFSIHPEKNTYFDYRNWRGGGPYELIAALEGIVPWEEVGPGCLSGELFKKVLDIAKKRGLIKGEPEPTEEAEEKVVRIQVPVLITDEFIAHEVFDGSTPAFVKYSYNGGEFEKVSEISLGETTPRGHPIVYVPVNNDHLEKGMVILPRWPKPCTFSEVISEAFDFLLKDDRFDACGHEDEVKLLGLVAIGSWFLEKMRPKVKVKIAGMGLFAPIIPIRGPSGSGKNRLANLLRMLSVRPYFDMSKTKIPSLYRPLDMWKGTLVLDEADFEKTGETSELIHFLNCRAQGTPIARQDPNNPSASQAFENFGLTILTQRRQFDDNATEGRAIPFYSEKTEKKPPAVEVDQTVEKGLELQDKLLYLFLKYYRDFEIDKSAWVDGITDPRLNAALLPVLAMGKFDHSVLEIVAKVAQKVEERKKKLKANSPDGIIINFIWDKLKDGGCGQWLVFYYLAEDDDRTGDMIPVSAPQVAEVLGWKPKGVRRVLDSLNLAPDEAPAKIRIGGRTYRPIFFDPKRLDKLLREFVLDYQPGALFKILNQPKQARFDDDDKNVPDVPHVPHPLVCVAKNDDNEKGGVGGQTETEGTHKSSGTSGTCGTDRDPVLVQLIPKLREYGSGAIVSPEKLAADLSIPIERVKAALEILIQRGAVITRGARAIEVV